MQVLFNFDHGGRKSDLTKEEKSQTVRSLSKGESTNDIAKKLQRDHQTIKRYVQNSQHGRKPRVEKAERVLGYRLQPYQK